MYEYRIDEFIDEWREATPATLVQLSLDNLWASYDACGIGLNEVSLITSHGFAVTYRRKDA